MGSDGRDPSDEPDVALTPHGPPEDGDIGEQQGAGQGGQLERRRKVPVVGVPWERVRIEVGKLVGNEQAREIAVQGTVPGQRNDGAAIDNNNF